MTAIEFALTVTELTAEQQNEFFSVIKKTLTEAEYLAAVEYISLTGLFKNQAKYKALRSAICKTLFGLEVSPDVKTMFEP